MEENKMDPTKGKASLFKFNYTLILEIVDTTPRHACHSKLRNLHCYIFKSENNRL